MTATNSPSLEKTVLQDARLTEILKAGHMDRLRLLSDEYRTSSDKELLVFVLITRLLLEHDRRASITTKVME